jgi:DNA adenine methylase
VGHILELLPNDIDRVVSPFFGGGSVEIAISKYLGLEVVGYDIFDILTNYWNVQINNPKELYRELAKLEPNKATYESIKNELRIQWKGGKKLPRLKQAVYYYYNHNLSYGPGFLGWPSSIYMDNKDRYQKIIEKVRDFKPGNLKVLHGSFEEAFEKYPNDFFYCDPPYYLGGDSKMFIGVYPMRNFPVHHNGFDHDKLRDLLKNHKGGFALSYNNCDVIREWYKEFDIFYPEWQYTMGQGETRIGKNRIEANINHVKDSHELLIFCPPGKD